MRTTSEIEEMKDFLNRFLSLEATLIEKRISQDLVDFQRLFTAFDPLDKRFQEFLAASAPDYNIFELLNISHLETKLHSPFLIHLLDPIANHQQGRLFFDAFMKCFLGDIPGLQSIKNVEIFKEYSCQSGRIDIVIFYEIETIKKAIVIENKIYHSDEQKQLERYYHFLSKERGFIKGNYHLVYLTPYRSIPSNYSIDEKIYLELKKEGSLIEVGYVQDIAPLLEQLISSIKAQNVKETVLQYIKTIKSL